MSTGLFSEEEDGYTLEETKYTLKVDAPASEPVSEPDSSDSDFGFGGDSEGGSFGDEKGPTNDKPFDDEPFDAGVEADEDEDPKKFIQQLAGKIGQSLRDYEKELTEPDFELEKFVINSVISATNTSEMDKEDQEDIIKKVETSGNDSELKSNDDDMTDDSEDTEEVDVEVKDEESLDEVSLGDDIEETFKEWSKPMTLKESVIVSDGLKHHLDNKIPLGESVFRYGSEKYVYLLKEIKSLYDNNLITLNENDEFIVNSAMPKVAMVNGEEILLNTIYEDVIDESDFINELDDVVANLPSFTQLAALGAPMLALIIRDILKGEKKAAKEKLEKGLNKEKNDTVVESMLNDLTTLLREAEYKGKKVELNKPKRGGSKKFYVYVRDPKSGNIRKVSFGAKSGGGNLAVKLKDPKARKAFSDRHNCPEKTDKTTAGYWSCALPRFAKSLGLSGGGRYW